jgi:hypothetical protein
MLDRVKFEVPSAQLHNTKMYLMDRFWYNPIRGSVAQSDVSRLRLRLSMAPWAWRVTGKVERACRGL